MDPRRSRIVVLACLLSCCLATCTADSTLEKPALKGCGDKLITVLDLDITFRDDANNRPACFPLTLMVTPSNGRVYITNNLTKDIAPHLAGAHAAGWFMPEAIKRSKNYTPHLEQADIVFVNDYCYWVWWLAWLNVGTLSAVKTRMDDHTPGDYLVGAYAKMMQMPRWLQKKGADFVFFDVHPGFYEGDAKHQIWPMRCGAMQRSVQILAGMPQRRRCPAFEKMKDRLVIAPLMAPVADPHNEDIYTRDIHQFWNAAMEDSSRRADFRPLHDRELLVYFKGRCDPHSKNHAGKRMRNHLVREAFSQMDESLKHGEAVSVTCLEDEVGLAAELLETAAGYGMHREAVFCLILPDDQQATKAVAEAFLAGCIPVFVGPPWHVMPLAGVVDYNATALFFKLEDTSAFLDKEMGSQGNATAHIGAHPQEAQWWSPDIPAKDLAAIAISVPDAHRIPLFLQKLIQEKKAEVASRMEAVWRERRRFEYHSFNGEVPGAVQTIMQEVCARNPGRVKVDWASRDVSNAAHASRDKTSQDGKMRSTAMEQAMHQISHEFQVQ